MLVVAVFAGAVGAAVAAAISSLLRREPPQTLTVPNYRGVAVPAVGGVVILASLLVTQALLALAAAVAGPAAVSRPGAFNLSAIAANLDDADYLALLLITVGFFSLGAVDDLLGPGTAKGLSGHAGALRRRILTGGVLKAVGGGALAVVAGVAWESRLASALIDAAIVVLSANLVNLLDLRPGRATKFFLVIWIPTAFAGWATPYLHLSAGVAGASAAWLPIDLAERGMLGDAGSNLLGAVLGSGLALLLGGPAKLAALVVLLLANLASERWSFTSVIERVRPLRWFDRLGRISET